MTDKKLTDSEIVSTLQKNIRDSERINSSYALLNLNFLKETLDLINRLQAEIRVKNKLLDKAEEKFEHYEKREVEWGKTFEKQFKENESLKEEIKNEQLYNLRMTAHSVKVEAYKECIGKAKNNILPMLTTATLEEKETICFCLNKLDNLLKELVGEDNGEEKE